MRKSKRNGIVSLISLLSGVVLLLGVGYFTYFLMGKGAESPEETTGFIKAPNEENSDEVAEDLEKRFPENMTEYGVQNAIHQMSHQKIKSDKKWGAVQITPERINRMIEIVKRNDYKNEPLYLEILNNWKEGDFSQADDEHNKIWRLQGGTVGEATGLLSAREEKEFIEEHFK